MRIDSNPHNGPLWRPHGPAEMERARRAVARGTLVRLLPGIYCSPDAAGDLGVRAAALTTHDPNAVVTGASAARLLWWPELRAEVLTAARRHAAPAAKGFEWEQRLVPAELTWRPGGVPVTSPALTVLDLIPVLQGKAIDEALRRRAATLPQMWQALELTPGRRGNPLRRTLLHDSRDEPWSEAERNLHRIYRSCDLPWAYRTNHWVTLADGRRTPLDLALPELTLGIEADGFEFHRDRPAFEYDRDRDSDLTAQCWHVVRISASFLEHHADEARRRVTCIVRERARLLGVA